MSGLCWKFEVIKTIDIEHIFIIQADQKLVELCGKMSIHTVGAKRCTSIFLVVVYGYIGCMLGIILNILLHIML